MQRWTDEELAYLRTHWPRQREEEIAQALGRTVDSVANKRHKLGLHTPKRELSKSETEYLIANWKDKTDIELASYLGLSRSTVQRLRQELGLLHRKTGYSRQTWTEEELEYLSENWGVISIRGICKTLGRTKNSVVTQKVRMGLGAFLDGGDYVTLNQLLQAVTGSMTSYSYKMTSWVENRSLPIHYKRVGECRFRVVYIDEFWRWAEKNRSFIDFSKMEPLALGKEPDWVPEQRKKDFQAYAVQRKDPWTPQEDSRLIALLKQHRYGYAELSDTLHRSAGAIQRRCLDLKIKERPVKADNTREWTDADYKTLADGIRRGDSYTNIGRAIGRSEKAVRGKVYFIYMTESADKIRAMMGNGAWGDGAPTPTVKQAIHLSRCRTGTLTDLSRLVGILAYRRNALGYEPYWQRHMCMKWHDFKGCTADQSNCDECTTFERIRPQYCVRCGATFIERETNKICVRCRRARKRQYFRKMRVLHGVGLENEGATT